MPACAACRIWPFILKRLNAAELPAVREVCELLLLTDFPLQET
jgi:hypothetical protein